MGYCVDMEVQGFVILADKVDDCLKAINDLHKQENLEEFAHGGAWSGGKQTQWHYSWVNNPSEGGFATLVEAFDEWRYDATLFPNGDVEVNCFNGEKLGDDKVLFDAIARFVNEKAEIACTGEDHAQWKWVFANGVCKELTGKVVYE